MENAVIELMRSLKSYLSVEAQIGSRRTSPSCWSLRPIVVTKGQLDQLEGRGYLVGVVCLIRREAIEQPCTAGALKPVLATVPRGV